MSLDYTWEKFHVAVLGLASGQGDIRQRLADAFVGSLIRLKPDELPEELRDDFRALQKELTSARPEGDEGTVLASTNTMSGNRAAELAKQIVSMYDGIAKRDSLCEYH